MTKKQLVLGLIVAALIAAIVYWGRGRIHFDFALFRAQVAQADWRKILLGIGCIYLAYVFRSARWARLIRPSKRVSTLSLLGTQVMGFTAVALIGRVADPVRPYLVAKKTGIELSSQVAVYIVERLFDMGSMALIFSVAMLWVPEAQIIQATSHSKLVSTLAMNSPQLAAFAARYGGLVLTIFGALFLLLIKISGNALASVCEHALSLVSKSMGHAVGHKIRAFHKGLDTMQSTSDFFAVTALSLGMWVLIAYSYLVTCQSFTASPELVALTAPKCVLLMASSGAASVIQLPIIGWFTQIGIVAGALVGIAGAKLEAATACAAMLLLVTFLSVVPVGLTWAQFENVSLRKVTHESEAVEAEENKELETEAAKEPDANSAPAKAEEQPTTEQ
ncbi:MAG TPA: lysylphosphatidylglycerol synthase transmembrane domain-containing protein [Terracidiphilus sp.]